jgi:hypothetical protein
MGRQPKTWEQPLQSILRRYRRRDVEWGVLECGHEEPITGLPMATAVRCQQCNPVWKRVEPTAGAAL